MTDKELAEAVREVQKKLRDIRNAMWTHKDCGCTDMKLCARHDAASMKISEAHMRLQRAIMEMEIDDSDAAINLHVCDIHGIDYYGSKCPICESVAKNGEN